MEGLMAEATDSILSPRRNTVTAGPNKNMKWDTGNFVKTPESSSSLNSFTLLRLSITNYIKDRHIEVEVPNEKPHNKGKRCIQSPKVDIRMLNSELATFHPESKACENESGSSLEQNKSDIGTKAFAELLDNEQSPDLEKSGTFRFRTETENYEKKDTFDNEEQKNRKKIAENGMKLASRKFSDSIFENCSTYSLACPEVLQERENIVPPKQELALDEQSPAGCAQGVNDHVCAEPVKNSTPDNDSCTDDQVSLSDSFFVNITSEENATQSSFFHKEGENSSSKKNNDKLEKDPTVPEYYSSSCGAQKRERKFSKKLRKRSRKSKSKDAPSYECPKCGVSYILSTKTSETTARCLHCDFWTSVEPEFLKREKQLWNTCRIC